MSASLIIVVILAGLGIGFLAGLFGVGGGLLMVPFLVLVMDESQHVAEGTSLAVIVPTAVAGVIVHIRHRNVSLRAGALMAVGGIAGAVLGASLALALDAEVLRRIFAVLVAAMGTRYVLQAIRKEEPAEAPEA